MSTLKVLAVKKNPMNLLGINLHLDAVILGILLISAGLYKVNLAYEDIFSEVELLSPFEKSPENMAKELVLFPFLIMVGVFTIFNLRKVVVEIYGLGVILLSYSLLFSASSFLGSLVDPVEVFFIWDYLILLPLYVLIFHLERKGILDSNFGLKKFSKGQVWRLFFEILAINSAIYVLSKSSIYG